MSVETDLWDARLEDVYELTARRTLVAETNLALRMATLAMHSCDKFPRDLQITDTSVSSSSLTELAISTVATPFERFRDVGAVQLLDVDGNPMTWPEIELCDLGGQYEIGYPGIRKVSCAWLAGTNLNVYYAGGFYGARVSWYQAPNITRATYNSWIAQIFPDPIVWHAAMIVWNRSGNEGKAKEAMTMLNGTQRNPELGLVNLLKMNYLTTAGR